MGVSVKSIPNALTIARIAVIPVFFMVFYSNWELSGFFTAFIFLFASLTDFFDGYLARALKAQSKFGKLFDPIADKMIVATAIIVLANTNRITGLTLVPAIIILCRELLVSGFREYLARSGSTLPVNGFGKLKTACQMTAIFLFLLNENNFITVLASSVLWVAGILSVISSYMYFKLCAAMN